MERVDSGLIPSELDRQYGRAHWRCECEPWAPGAHSGQPLEMGRRNEAAGGVSPRLGVGADADRQFWVLNDQTPETTAV